MDRARVAIIGASGYTGAELLRLLLAHPRAEVTLLMARERTAPSVATILPHLTGLCDLPIVAFDAERVAREADVAFCALPHKTSQEVVSQLLARGVRVFDLSADFRLRDPNAYESWYGSKHLVPELLPRAVYGLVELHRESLRGATLVAVPGCYPTASTLPLLPLFARGLAHTNDVVIHALSGVSGGGRTPGPSYHFPETSEGVRSYKAAGNHRHTGEIEQTLSHVAKRDVRVTFTPTLVPATRGILSTVYVRPAREVTAEELTQTAREYYRESASVAVLDAGAMPDTLWVRGSNRAHVAYSLDARAGWIVAMCAIDNLVKGASGQAVQCMNVALGWDEGLGLRAAPTWP